ncbi:MAG: nitroreductase family protein [Turneriella sp.]
MRTPDFPVDKEFTDRWSPRGFDPSVQLSDTELKTLFEAARWAPSCANEQSWQFYHAKDDASRALFLSFLNEANQYWAKNASHIIIVCARKTFAASGKPNAHSWYDAGAAWMSLALQARKMGYHAHCMAGIQHAVIAEKLKIDTAAVDIVTAIAVGKQGDASHLNERHKAQETPNARKPQNEFVFAV